MSSTGTKRKSDAVAADTNIPKKVKTSSGAVKPHTQSIAPAEPNRRGNGKEKHLAQVTSAPRISPAADASTPESSIMPHVDARPATQPRRPRIRKLAPPRPFPTVAPASSVTGPRSAHHEGKNNICVTRKTKLAAYLRRCRALLVDDGFKELRLSAMGAAIPHLTLLAVSLPQILPWAQDEVKVKVFTGSVEVHDEILSESGSDEGEGPEEEFRTRVKSTMNIIIRIGEGEPDVAVSNSDQGQAPRPTKKKSKRKENRVKEGGGQREGAALGQIVLREPDQDHP
ncbi:hypothetical protein PAXRUDRAFT_822435 [Paxillus rubicundulus Ve08.2h10]|uniref:Uncharacterized protein n=1 Tax=Paxillus rubicundulus Ve08.2h10 TaxID=930991 RepID=A0A0D0E581_9AGAM|nr:hypothetical protein PAXRUDRAFT_822435 [Paxillus rubicundulus Ve08.2h10]